MVSIGPAAMTRAFGQNGNAVADRVQAIEIVGDHEHA